MTIADTSGVTYADGDDIIPVSTLDFMRGLSLELALNDIIVDGYEISASPREIRLSLVGEKYDLIVSVDRPTESIISDLISALANVDKSKSSVNEYIDLRIVDKVFYR